MPKPTKHEADVDFLVGHTIILYYNDSLEVQLASVDKTLFDDKVKEEAKKRLSQKTTIATASKSYV